MRSPRQRHLKSYMPTAASIVVLALLIVFVSVVSGSWGEELRVSGSVHTGNWSTPTATPDRTGTIVDVDQTATGFFENGQAGVRGQIYVENGGSRPTRDLKVVDTIQVQTAPGQYIQVVQAVIDLSAKPVLNAGEHFHYDYRITFDPVPGIPPQPFILAYVNTAKASITNRQDWMPGDPNCPGPALCAYERSISANFSLPLVPMALPPTGTATMTATPTATLKPPLIPVTGGATSTPVPPPPSATPSPVRATPTAVRPITPSSAMATPTVTSTPTATATATATTPAARSTPTAAPTSGAEPTTAAQATATRIQATATAPSTGAPPGTTPPKSSATSTATATAHKETEAPRIAVPTSSPAPAEKK